MTLSANNPLSSAREAVFKEDISNFQTELEIYKAEMKYKGQIPENLFVNNTEISNFHVTFVGCAGLVGNSPALWERENVTNYAQCFKNCANLSNYADIPDSWK